MNVKNCPVTRSDTSILKFYGKQNDGTFHTGVDILATSVYSISNGVVINIVSDQRGKYTVAVQYDATRCLRYGNLDAVTVALGDIIESRQLLGTCSKYTHFEDCVSTARSNFVFRAGRFAYYKQDPISLVTQDSILFSTFKNLRNPCF